MQSFGKGTKPARGTGKKGPSGSGVWHRVKGADELSSGRGNDGSKKAGKKGSKGSKPDWYGDKDKRRRWKQRQGQERNPTLLQLRRAREYRSTKGRRENSMFAIQDDFSAHRSAGSTDSTKGGEHSLPGRRGRCVPRCRLVAVTLVQKVYDCCVLWVTWLSASPLDGAVPEHSNCCVF